MDPVTAVRVEIYRGFIEDGTAPLPPRIAATLDLSEQEVMSALRHLDAGDVIAFAPGSEDLWLAHPFCATDGPFEVSAPTGSWQAICVWDALGILALLGSDGSVKTRCPDCGERLQLSIVDGEIGAPPGAVVHFGVPAARWYEDIAFT